MIPNILSIAGSDPSGGAGIQADIKSISANGGYAMAAIAALTAQNTRGVKGVELVSAQFVSQQINTIFDDIKVDAVKIGMLGTHDIITAVAKCLSGRKVPIVIDPVMVAKGGDRLLAKDAVSALITHLVPLASIITPNLPEAADLLETDEAKSRSDMQAQALALLELGPDAVFLKGGHLEGDTSPDLLMSKSASHWFEADRLKTKNTHGTGCTLSSALATQIAIDGDIVRAANAAKSYVRSAISHAELLQVGEGHGPTNHFFAMRKEP